MRYSAAMRGSLSPAATGADATDESTFHLVFRTSDGGVPGAVISRPTISRIAAVTEALNPVGAGC